MHCLPRETHPEGARMYEPGQYGPRDAPAKEGYSATSTVITLLARLRQADALRQPIREEVLL